MKAKQKNKKQKKEKVWKGRAHVIVVINCSLLSSAASTTHP
jgi:hypothetical protein